MLDLLCVCVVLISRYCQYLITLRCLNLKYSCMIDFSAILMTWKLLTVSAIIQTAVSALALVIKIPYHSTTSFVSHIHHDLCDIVFLLDLWCFPQSMNDVYSLYVLVLDKSGLLYCSSWTASGNNRSQRSLKHL